MADNSFRNLRGDALARDGAAAQRDSISDDPLAELARLIGQSDPQSPLGRLAVPPAEAPDETADEAAPPALDWSALEQDHGQQGHDLQQNFAAARSAAYPQFPAADASWRRNAGGDNEPGAMSYSPPAALFEDAIAAARQVDGYSDELGSGITGSQAFPYIPPAHDDNASDGQYQAHGSSDAEADAANEYRGEAADGRRRAAVVIVAVLGVLVAGSAGALGYHAMFGGSMIPSLPPIIKPGSTPVKIVPKKTASAGTSSQAVADAGASGDRLVSREEKPVTVQSADPMPRVVTTIPVIANPADESPLPGAMPPAGAQQPSAPSAPSAPVPFDQFSGPASPASGSKPVQTVIIKPVQSSPAKGPAAAPAPTSARAERARPPSKTARQPQSRIASVAPLSIVPTQSSRPEAHAMGGRYSVQVSSERSEAEARAAFRALQAKFPQQLGQRTGLIRRANLGAKGVYYRVFVGPFVSAEQASSLCGSLKAAGAGCLVQRN
jgi:hypothetical protein